MAGSAVFPSPSFGSDRQRQDLTAIAGEHQPPASSIAPNGIGRIDTVALNAGVHQLAQSPDPAIVFAQLAALLVPAVCERAAVTVHSGSSLAGWEQGPDLFGDIPTIHPGPAGAVWTLTVHTAGRTHPDPAGQPAVSDTHPGDSDDGLVGPDYIAAINCHGRGEPPTAGDVALIKMAGRCAASLVHQARQTQLLLRSAQRTTHLRIALTTNRTISAAVGILMAQQLITYTQAFQQLTEASQLGNVKLAAIAEHVLDTGTLPDAA